LNPRLLLNGADKTSRWLAEQSEIKATLGRPIDTATLEFDDDGTLSLPDFSEVIIGNTTGDTRYFGGFITGKGLAEIDGVRKHYVCDAQDYTVLLERRRVNKIYEAKTTEYIIRDLFRTYLPEILIGPGLLFDADDCVTIPSSPRIAYSTTGSYTWAFWIMPTGLSDRFIVSKASFPLNGYSIRVSATGFLQLWTPLPNTITVTALQAYRWYHVVITLAGTTCKCYLNGVLDKTTTVTRGSNETTANMTLGCSSLLTFAGYLKEFRFYDRALADYEALRLFEGGNVSDTDLEVWFEFQEGSGSTVEDLAGGDDDGTITGATWALDYIEDGITVDRIVFARCTLADAIDRLAELNGFEWYVDYFKFLHFFAEDTNAAAFGLSTSPDNVTTFPFRLTRYDKDASALVNKVTVSGGVYYSADTYLYRPGDGSSTEIWVPYKLHAPSGETAIKVWKWNGSSWVAQTVGADYLDSLTDYNVLYNYQEKLLKFAVAPGNYAQAVKIQCQYEVSVLRVVRNYESYNEYGRWLEDVIVDTAIVSDEVADLRGANYLTENALAKESGTVEITKDGLRVGDYVHVHESIRGIDGDYLVRALTTRFLGNQVAQYTAEFGRYYPGLIDLLIDLKRKSHAGLPYDDTTTLHELLPLPKEAVGVEDVSHSVSSHETAHYHWGPSDNVGKWGYFTWK